MNLLKSMPVVFNRTWPAIDPETQLLLALKLLRSHHIDALPVTQRETKKVRFISGYSCLNELVHTIPSDYGKFLGHSCNDVSLELPTVSANEGIGALLQVYSRTQFGFAWVETGDAQLGAFIRLGDLISLYGSGTFRTELTIESVASRDIFSLEEDTNLKSAIEEMIKRKKRRVFLTRNQKVISDRQIIACLFSEPRLSTILADYSKLLDGKLKDVPAEVPTRLKPHLTVNEAAPLLLDGPGVALCDVGLITPWDLIIKPWERNELSIKE